MLAEFPSSKPPQILLKILEIAKKTMRLKPNARLHFIKRVDLRKHFPNLTHVGSIGEADYENQIAYVCESDDGIATTCSTLVHELLHLKDEAHKCHYEGDNFYEETRYWEREIFKTLSFSVN